MGGTVYEQISFDGDLLNITFSEEHERGDAVAMVRTLVIDGPRKAPTEFAEFMDALQALVDVGIRSLRNPPRERPSH